MEDSAHLRGKLEELSLVAFVADGALLPRLSGVDDRPLGRDAVPFRSPESLRMRVELRHAGAVMGMGVSRGVTLIVGGGYHGKSTLLSALELGVYDHVPGDGRELVVCERSAVKVRAEDGRRVVGVDISPFISNLPGGGETRDFRSDNASGSTSQAASIVEALEAGARVLLVDEDTAATNFMIRDHRMQRLVSKQSEPITPFVDRVGELYRELGVSTVLVMGGSGDYFDEAHTVIAMEEYRPSDVTEEAKRIARESPTFREIEVASPLPPLRARIPVPGSLDPSKGRRDVAFRARGTRTLLFGSEEIDLSAVEQLADPSQVRAIGRALARLTLDHIDGRRTVVELLDRVEEILEREGLDGLDRSLPGDSAAFRRQELAAALSRRRSRRPPAGTAYGSPAGACGCSDAVAAPLDSWRQAGSSRV